MGKEQNVVCFDSTAVLKGMEAVEGYHTMAAYVLRIEPMIYIPPPKQYVWDKVKKGKRGKRPPPCSIILIFFAANDVGRTDGKLPNPSPMICAETS